MEQTTAVPMQLQPQPRRNYRRHLWGFLFVLPAIVTFTLFLWWPIGKGLLDSLYKIDFVKGNSYVGFDNYKTIFTDPDVWTSVKNTFKYMALGLVIGGAVSNVIDRVVYGAVADFFLLHYGGFEWYVFNVADVWIVAGAVGLVLAWLTEPAGRRREKATDA